MSRHDLFVVAGAGGFIGGHLVKMLREEGFEKIRAVDQKPISEWYQVFDDVENHALDFKGLYGCRAATKGATVVYNLPADMDGMGFIERNKATCMISVRITTNPRLAPPQTGVRTV